MAKEGLKRAIELADGQSALGRMIGVKQQTISKWMRLARQPVPPAEAVEPIVRQLVQRGKVIRAHDLRPDLFPEGFTFPGEQIAAGCPEAVGPVAPRCCRSAIR
jgi:hypothetical protein